MHSPKHKLNELYERMDILAAKFDASDESCLQFVDHAADALNGFNFQDFYSTELVEHALRSCRALQIDTDFSDLQAVLYDNGKFYVELLHWNGKDALLHDHNFAGLFYQVEGASLSVNVDFKPETDPRERRTLGQCSALPASIVRKGESLRVCPVRTPSHAVIHLERPTVGFIVRTHQREAFSPQQNVLPPFVRADASVIDLGIRKELQLLRIRARQSSFYEAYRAFLADKSPAVCFWSAPMLSDLLSCAKSLALLESRFDDGGKSFVSLQTFLVSNVVLRTLMRHAQSLQDRVCAGLIASCWDHQSLTESIVGVADYWDQGIAETLLARVEGTPLEQKLLQVRWKGLLG